MEYPLKDCGARSADVVVLVVYTEAAESWARGSEGVAAWIRVAESRTNQSFRQSGVRYRVKLLKGLMVPSDKSPPKNMGDTLANLVGAKTQKWSAVHDQMKERHASLVILLDTAQGGGVACPLSEVGNSLRGSPFAVVAVESMSVADVLTHELGHMLGSGHSEGPGAFSSSHGHRDDSKEQQFHWRSIMERDSSCSGCAMILYWSNPAENGPAGRPMGVDLENNAGSLNRTMCVVAGPK